MWLCFNEVLVVKMGGESDLVRGYSWLIFVIDDEVVIILRDVDNYLMFNLE